MRHAALYILIVQAAFACVNYEQFADLSAGWQDTHDLPELAAFADTWLDGCEIAADPNAFVTIVNAIPTHTLSPITFTAEHYDYIQINTLPAAGTLYDYYGTSRNAWTDVRRVPYIIKRRANLLYYLTEDAGTVDFLFSAHRFDGAASYPATAQITATAYEPNELYFDGNATVTIPHAPELGFDDSFAFAMWFYPLNRTGTLIEKRDGGAGLQISLRAGHVVVEVWNADGVYGRTHAWSPVYLHMWNFLCLSLGNADPDDDSLTLMPGDGRYGSGEYGLHLPPGPYSNTADTVIGRGFVGMIDKPVWFAGAVESYIAACIGIEARNNTSAGLMVPPHAARFHMSEAAGSTITADPNTAIIGTINGAMWVPDDTPRRNTYHYQMIGR